MTVLLYILYTLLLLTISVPLITMGVLYFERRTKEKNELKLQKEMERRASIASWMRDEQKRNEENQRYDLTDEMKLFLSKIKQNIGTRYNVMISRILIDGYYLHKDKDNLNKLRSEYIRIKTSRSE